MVTARVANLAARAAKAGPEAFPADAGGPGGIGGIPEGGGGAGGPGGRGGIMRARAAWWQVAIGIIIVTLSIGTLALLQRVNSNSNHVKAVERTDARAARALIAALEKANDREDATERAGTQGRVPNLPAAAGHESGADQPYDRRQEPDRRPPVLVPAEPGWWAGDNPAAEATGSVPGVRGPRKGPAVTTYNSLGFDHRPNSARYGAIHEWVNDTYPKTGRCEWCGQTGRYTQYAVARPGFFTRNRADWLELCVPCHRAYDGPRVLSDEARAKMSAARKGKTLSAETRAKLSAINTGKKLPPETLAKMSAANKGKMLSAEHRAKIAEAARKRHAQGGGASRAALAAGQQARRARERKEKKADET